MYEYFLGQYLNAGFSNDCAVVLAKRHYEKYKLHIGREGDFADDPIEDINYIMGFTYAFQQMLLMKTPMKDVKAIVDNLTRTPASKESSYTNHILGMQRGLWECEKLADMISELLSIKTSIINGETPPLIVFKDTPKSFH